MESIDNLDVKLSDSLKIVQFGLNAISLVYTNQI